METSHFMAQRCRAYLDARAAYENSYAGATIETYACLSRMLRPVGFPFAGRVRNIRELMDVFRGNSHIREEQCSIWMFFANLLCEDLVGPHRHPHVYELAESAALDVAVLQNWVETATAMKTSRIGRVPTLDEIDPRIDLLRMDWHPVRQLQLATRRVRSAVHQSQRYWSRTTREQFVNDGGLFSQIEKTSRSPLGWKYLPWMDATRFFEANPDSPFVQEAMRLQIPLLTGVSGVGMHTFHFARVLGIADWRGVLLAALAYLLPIEQHSYYEVLLSSQEKTPSLPSRFRYSDCAPLDWDAVNQRCEGLLDVG